MIQASAEALSNAKTTKEMAAIRRLLDTLESHKGTLPFPSFTLRLTLPHRGGQQANQYDFQVPGREADNGERYVIKWCVLFYARAQ